MMTTTTTKTTRWLILSLCLAVGKAEMPEFVNLDANAVTSDTRDLSGDCGSIDRCIDTNRCRSIEECPYDQYCSRGICRDNGTCQTRNDCLNPQNVYFDTLCFGRLICFEGRCITDCNRPQCGNKPVADCFGDPCMTQSCSEPYLDCTSNSCGGCNAIFFNEKGYQVCKPNDNNEGGDDPFPQCESSDCGSKPRKAKKCPDGFMYRASDCQFDFQEQRCRWKFPQCPTCSSDDDCPSDQYCGGGKCRQDGSCRDRIDCLNPSNSYATVRCNGYLDCENNRCRQVCSGRRCPPGLFESNCARRQCPRTRCRDSLSCVENRCGSGCHPVFFNAEGDQVCRRRRRRSASF